MKDKNKDNEQLPDTKPGKKTYYQPELQVYGNLRDITQAVSNQGGIDGGVSPSPTRTHN